MDEQTPDGVDRFLKACADASAVRSKVDTRAWLGELRQDPALLKEAKQTLIADLIRVYNHPENPYKGWAASRKRYRELGHYPEGAVEALFGNHEEYQRAAGLRDLRNTTRSRNKSARLHTEGEIARFAQETVTAHAGKYDWLSGTKKEHIDIVVGSDFHSAYCDPFALRVYLDVIRLVRPDAVIANGDLVDFPEISRFPQFPGHFPLSLQGDIDSGSELLRKMRAAAPDATLYYVMGNHDYRLVRFMADTAPAVCSLRTNRFHEQFPLDELEVSLVCRSNFLAPTRERRSRDIAENWVQIAGCFVATHGEKCGKDAARKEMARFGMSGTSGHVHDPVLVFERNLAGWSSWMSTPAMANVAAVGKDYVWGPTGWTMGFGVVSIYPKARAVSQQLVIVHDEWATFGGRTWTVTKAEKAARIRMGVV